MNRRSLLKGSLALAAGLILPPSLTENVEAARRYWSLDRTMVPQSDALVDYWMNIGPHEARFAYAGHGVIEWHGHRLELTPMAGGRLLATTGNQFYNLDMYQRYRWEPKNSLVVPASPYDAAATVEIWQSSISLAWRNRH